MSKLPGLSLIAKDPDNLNKEVRFINIDNTSSDEPIFISGTATDIYEQDGTTLKSSTIDNVAHGKFSKLSLVSNTIQSVNDCSDIEKGTCNYMYVDIQTGQLKTNSFIDLFENHILTTNIIIINNLVLKDSTNENISLTGDELKKIKLLLSS